MPPFTQGGQANVSGIPVTGGGVVVVVLMVIETNDDSDDGLLLAIVGWDDDIVLIGIELMIVDVIGWVVSAVDKVVGFVVIVDEGSKLVVLDVL